MTDSTQHNKALIRLHLSVLVAGATGLFGRWVSLQEIPLVWYRLLITTLLFIPILHFMGKLRLLPLKEALPLMGVGSILGIHWVFFYASIQASNVSIGVVCLALIGMFTAIIDPIVNHHRFRPTEFILSSFSLLGLLLIFHLDTRYRIGIALGSVAALLAVMFTVMSKKVLGANAKLPTHSVVLYEMIGGLVCLSIVFPINVWLRSDLACIPLPIDWFFLIVLALVCTIGQYMLQLSALKQVSPFTMNLTYNLEPIYSIILAMVIFNESRELNYSFYAGLSLIILSVVAQNFIQWKEGKGKKTS